ncbi:MAG: SMP-30/gluconolactonase/LRE family protein [Gemmataceae bacterium]|nr:SMP-30/gluconolactonase/LRE family protein [Gemmataceae bacterium]
MTDCRTCSKPFPSDGASADCPACLGAAWWATPVPPPRSLPWGAVAVLAAVAVLGVVAVVQLLPRRPAEPARLADCSEEPPPAAIPAKPDPLPRLVRTLHPPRPLSFARAEAPPVIVPPPVLVLKPLDPPVKKDEKRPVVLKRRRDLGEAGLLNQARRVPALNFDRSAGRNETGAVVAAHRAAKIAGKPLPETTLAMIDKRADLSGLPLRRGDECKLTPTAAASLDTGSLALREMLATSAGQATVRRAAAGPAEAGKLSDLLGADKTKFGKWNRPEGVPALMQMLMGEADGVREVLVDQVARIEGKPATQALAQLAVFDLHPRVREAAVKALAARPSGDFLPALLKAFSHPWPPIADHAAEAIAALKLKEAVPGLLRVLDDPDPRAAYRKPGDDKPYVREMVRVNHLRNCMLCHPPSMGTDDKVRGLVPTPGQPIPQGVPYYQGNTGLFVRADVTYLKQDFSVSLPVSDHGAWPAAQRYDFFVRERLARESEVGGEPVLVSDQHKAAFFALRELTGLDPGPTASDWKKAMRGQEIDLRVRYAGLDKATAVAIDGEGRAWIADGTGLLTQEGYAEPKTVMPGGTLASLLIDAKGRMLASRRHPTDLALREGKGWKALAAELGGKPLASTGPLAVDGAGGVWLAEHSGILYRSALGSLSRSLAAPKDAAGLALSPDGKMLYSLAGDALRAHPVESAGSALAGKRLAALRSADGLPGKASALAIDRRGRLYAANLTGKTVEVFNAAGARLQTVRVPERPVALAVGGPKGDTLVVLSEETLYSAALGE